MFKIVEAKVLVRCGKKVFVASVGHKGHCERHAGHSIGHLHHGLECSKRNETKQDS